VSIFVVDWPIRYRVERTRSRHTRLVRTHDGQRATMDMGREFVDADDFDQLRERLAEVRDEGDHCIRCAKAERDEAIAARDEAIAARERERAAMIRVLTATLREVMSAPVHWLAEEWNR
jgi:hypothetical protein